VRAQRGNLIEPEFDSWLIYSAFQSNRNIATLGNRANRIEDTPSGERVYKEIEKLSATDMASKGLTNGLQDPIKNCCKTTMNVAPSR